MQYVRSLFFVIQMYAMMAIIGLVSFPWALFDRRGAVWACKLFCRWVRWTAAWMVGLKSEVRGPVPQGEVMVASKHQSFFDIILLYSALPAGKFIMKRELLWVPFVGQYAKRIGCVPVERGRRGAAIKQMLQDVSKGLATPGQLVIYPQGTRVAPAKYLPYKLGSHVLYSELDQPCVPAATNVGVFWPRTGIMRKPGLAVVEFLEPILQGQSRQPFMEELEHRIESKSQDLMREAGFTDFPEETGAASPN